MIYNGLMMQYFEGHQKSDGSLWNMAAEEAKQAEAKKQKKKALKN